MASLDYSTAFLAAFLLLVLSLLTIEFCRRDSVSTFSDIKSYLFRGKTPLHSLASNVGATFSTTYFFGAVIVYSKLLNTWALVPIVASCLVAFLLYRRLLQVTRAELNTTEPASQRTNVLLHLLQTRMAPKSFRSLTMLYSIVYLGLLVEELAVSRAVLASIFPGRPVIGGLLLAVLTLVVLVYLYVGGFRAVLISDFVQVVVLTAFVGMLVYLTLLRTDQAPVISFQLQLHPGLGVLNTASAAVLGIAWFLCGVDFSSRLNFDTTTGQDVFLARSRLMRHSFVAIALTFGVGVLFAQASDHILEPGLLPADYLAELSAFFLSNTPRILRITFLISVFCMIFTTVDTLLLAVMQVSHFNRRLRVGRSSLAQLLVIGAVFSVALPVNSLYVFGILVGSWIILPLFPIVRALFPHLTWIPGRPYYLWFSLVVSGLCVAYFSSPLIAQPPLQFLIPGAVFLLAVASLAAQTAGAALVRKVSR